MIADGDACATMQLHVSHLAQAVVNRMLAVRHSHSAHASHISRPCCTLQVSSSHIMHIHVLRKPQLLHTALTRCGAAWSGGLALPLGAAAGARESAPLSPRPADSAGAAALGMHDSSVEFLQRRGP